MPTLNTTRAELIYFRTDFLPYILNFKRTRIENCPEKDYRSPMYQGAVTINCLVDEIAILVEKKIITTTSKKVKLQLTRGHANVLFTLLLNFPIPSDQVYKQMMRNRWLELLDAELQQDALEDEYRLTLKDLYR